MAAAVAPTDGGGQGQRGSSVSAAGDVNYNTGWYQHPWPELQEHLSMQGGFPVDVSDFSLLPPLTALHTLSSESRGHVAKISGYLRILSPYLGI